MPRSEHHQGNIFEAKLDLLCETYPTVSKDDLEEYMSEDLEFISRADYDPFYLWNDTLNTIQDYIDRVVAGRNQWAYLNKGFDTKIDSVLGSAKSSLELLQQQQPRRINRRQIFDKFTDLNRLVFIMGMTPNEESIQMMREF